MQNRKTLERGSMSSWHEERLDVSGRCAVHLEAIYRRDVRYAPLRRPKFPDRCEFIAVFLFSRVVSTNRYCLIN